MGSPARLADDTAQGKTTIAASVVQKIAGIAAREISGVYAMGGGVSRAFGAIRERIPGGGAAVTNVAGVQVEVGEKQAAVDLDIVVEYGASIVDLARAVRRNVITAVERMTGLEVDRGQHRRQRHPPARVGRRHRGPGRPHARTRRVKSHDTMETRMNATRTGLLAGLILGAAGSIGGFGPFLITLIVGIVGLLVGMTIDGQLDLTALLGRGRDR